MDAGEFVPVPVQVTAVGAVLAERAGSAGAIAETSNEIGNALGIAFLGSLAALIFRLQGPDLAPTLDETLQLGDLSAAAVTQAKTAFVTGLHSVAIVAILLHVALGSLALRWLPRAHVPGPELRATSATDTVGDRVG